MFKMLPNTSYEFPISYFHWNIIISSLKGLAQYFKMLTTHYIIAALLPSLVPTLFNKPLQRFNCLVFQEMFIATNLLNIANIF